MINSFKLQNFAPIKDIECNNLGNINLIIGINGTGKTILLKALYTAIKTLEEYKRGNDPRRADEILADKLYWTFEVEKIGDLVRKGVRTSPLSFELIIDNKKLSYQLYKEAIREVKKLINETDPRSSNSIFFPPKEVLSFHHLILESRELDQVFGFDNTYLDLARALRQSPQKGNNYSGFSDSRKNLSDLLKGKIEYDESLGIWQFKQGNQTYFISLTAEGIKKISILDTLLGNRYLDPKSIIFIDELEAALHPTAISKLLDIIKMLSKCGIQFFIASHSYFVIKKLFLISQTDQDLSISIISANDEGWSQTNLRDGLPDNPIIDESIRLYKEEVRLALDE